MPSRIVVAPENLNPLSSATDQFILGQESGWADETIEDASTPVVVARDGTRTGGHMARLQPLVTQGDLQQSKELIELMYKTGHAGATKQAPGPETIINGITFALSGDGILIPFQMITQDREPSYVHLGRVLDTTAINVVASGTSLSGTLTPDDDLTSEDQALELKITLSSATLTATDTPGTLTVNGNRYCWNYY